MLRLAGVVLVLSAASAVVGAAASMALSSGSVGAARVGTPRCTADALSILPNLSGSAVASVTIETIPSSCGGASLKVTVDNGTTSGSGSATVPGGGGSLTVTISGAPALVTAVTTYVVMEGP